MLTLTLVRQAPGARAVELTVEKPGAVRFARSVGLTIYRTREEVLGP